MQPSEAPRLEIDRARSAIKAMCNAKSVAEFDDGWKHFLHRTERAWNKTKAHYQRSPKWGNWASKFDLERKQDPLLSYLCNARGADEHTTAEVTGREPGSIGINLADGVGVQPDGSILIEHLQIESKPGELHIASSQPLKITFFPESVRMVPITNRGRIYPVPTSHLGQAIDPSNLPAVAEIAVGYYESVLQKAEDFFVK